MRKKVLSVLPLLIFGVLILGVLYLIIKGYLPSTGPENQSPEAIVKVSVTLTSISTSANTPAPSPTNTPTNVAITTPTDTATPTDTPIPPPTSTPEPTDTPPPSTDTPTPTPSPTPEAVVVAADGLNLRAGPGTLYDVIDSLGKGDILDVQGRIVSNEWIQVIPANPGKLGWVSSDPGLVRVNMRWEEIPVVASLPPPPPTPTLATPTSVPLDYPVPILTGPDNGSGAYGTFPPLFWTWDGELAEDEYFEVRVWHESVTDYRPSLGWVKGREFSYNISGERHGKYYWSVVVVKDPNIRFKDWYRSDLWPYPVWEHEPNKDANSIQFMSEESELRFFNFTPSSSGGGSGGGGQSAISNPSSCDEPPCD